MTLDGAPVLDLAVIADLRAATGDDDEFILDLVATYLSEGAEHIERMAVAVATGDVAAMVRPAHTLKSGSASIGAMRLSELCRAIEEAARAGGAGDFAADVDRARAAWSATVDALAAAGLTR